MLNRQMVSVHKVVKAIEVIKPILMCLLATTNTRTPGSNTDQYARNRLKLEPMSLELPGWSSTAHACQGAELGDRPVDMDEKLAAGNTPPGMTLEMLRKVRDVAKQIKDRGRRCLRSLMERNTNDDRLDTTHHNEPFPNVKGARLPPPCIHDYSIPNFSIMAPQLRNRP